jgi:methionine aminopeptidase
LERGIAFPTCVSVNHIVGHYSPLADESTTLKEGDVVKIICGSHIDGYAANTAVTIVVGDKIEGRRADVILAAHHALKAAERVI